MDWEKRTTQRGELNGTAGDSNGYITPGQALLSSLQSSELLRKERFANTVDGKMKAAREKLADEAAALQPLHAPRSDEAIFKIPAGEVHGLLPDSTAAQTELLGVKAMLLRRAERHEAALQRMREARDAAGRQLDTDVSSMATQLKDDLQASRVQVESDMEVLQDEHVMKLTEAAIQEVWQRIAVGRPQRATAIDQLGTDLEAAETTRRCTVQAALATLVAELTDIAHVSPGEIERILEAESLALNQALLDNRKAYADLLKRLHVAEVQLEETRRRRWLDALSRWRTLRTRHALATFADRIRSAEFAEPPARVAMLGMLRDGAEAAHGALQQYLQGLEELLPPRLKPALVQAWVEAGKQLHERWAKELQSTMDRLSSHEDGLESDAQRAFAEVKAEALTYKGYSDEEVLQLVQQECAAPLAERRAAALSLLSQVRSYCERQAAEWVRATEALSSWLQSVCTAYQQHKRQTTIDEEGTKAALREAQAQFQNADHEREKRLEEAITAVSHGGSEKALDACVAAASRCLDDIEAGYRSHQTNMTAVAQHFPVLAREHEEEYIETLCGLLQLRSNLPPPPPPPPSATPPAAAPAAANGKPPVPSARRTSQSNVAAGQAQRPPSGNTNKSGSARRTSVSDAPVPPPPAPAPPPEKPMLQLPSGAKYIIWEDLAQSLVQPEPTAAEAPAAEAAEPSGAVTPLAAVAATAASASPAGSAAVAVPSTALGTAAAPTELVTGPLSAREDRLQTPRNPEGQPYCRALPVDLPALRAILARAQVALLTEQEQFAARLLAAADAWAADRELAFTEELDQRLRAHRPRAGAIEEDVRSARSVELVGQRRRVEGHMREQGRAVEAQKAASDEWLQRYRQDADRAAGRVRGFEKLLGSCMSCKSLDIRVREAEALRAKLERDLAAQCEALTARVRSSCADVESASDRFDREHLKGIAEGGKYAPETIDNCRRSLASLHVHVQAAMAAQLAAVEQARLAAVAQLGEALAAVKSALPAHTEDMALIEAMDRALEAARKKARTALQRNSDAAADIDSELGKLEALLAAQARSSSSSSTSSPTELAGPSSPGTGRDDRAASAEIVRVTDALRCKLLVQARALQYLQSTSLLASLRTDNNHTTEAPAAGSRPSSQGTERGKGTPTPPSAKATKGTAAAAAAATATGRSEAPSDVLSLSKETEAVINQCKTDVDGVAKAYYAAKAPGRPICYPARIPATAEEMLQVTDGVLTQLREALTEHMASGVKTLRLQVARACRALEQVPQAALSALASHELAAAATAQQELLQAQAAQHDAILQQIAEHKRLLHPAMVQPTRRAELEEIKAREAARAIAAERVVSSCASAALQQAAAQGPAVGLQLLQLTRALLQLLDGFPLLQDLPVPPPGTDPLQGLPRKGLRELQALALAQASVEAVPVETSGKVGKQSSDNSRGDSKAKAGAAATKPTAESRPFGSSSWNLLAGCFALDGLGWTTNDTAAMVRAAAAAAAVTAAATTAAAPAGGGPAAPAAPAAAPVAGKQQPAPQAVAAWSLPTAPRAADEVVASTDTPYHRQVVRAHAASIKQVEAHMSAVVRQHAARLRQWYDQEQLWQRTWERLLQELDSV